MPTWGFWCLRRSPRGGNLQRTMPWPRPPQLPPGPWDCCRTPALLLQSPAPPAAPHSACLPSENPASWVVVSTGEATTVGMAMTRDVENCGLRLLVPGASLDIIPCTGQGGLHPEFFGGVSLLSKNGLLTRIAVYMLGTGGEYLA